MKKTIFSLLLLAALPLGLAALAHPIHVGLTSLTYQPEQRAFQVVVKLFRDDFEDAVEASLGVRLGLGTDQELADWTQWADRYVKERLEVVVNNVNRGGSALRLTGHRTDHEALWLEYVLPERGPVRRVVVRNRLMTEHFDDQTNLLIFVHGPTEEAYKLDGTNTEAEILLANP